MSRTLLVSAVAVAVAVVVTAVLAVLVGPPPEPGRAGGATTTAAVPDRQEARVTDHSDGDTLRLVLLTDGPVGESGQELKVRLLEIDTPELARDGEAAECYAEEASEALRRLLPVGSTVEVEPDEELLDPFDRTLLYLWVERDGASVLVNEVLVRGGYATAVLFEPNDRYIDRMRRAEQEARADGAGLWGVC